MVNVPFEDVHDPPPLLLLLLLLLLEPPPPLTALIVKVPVCHPVVPEFSVDSER